jgi:hypothetical protein
MVFTKDEKGKIIVILKYVTTSYTYNILDIEDVVSKEGEDSVVTFKYKASLNVKNENFRTNECANIIKVFNDLKNKALKIVDEKKREKEEKMKNRQLQSILNKQLFG